MRTASILLALIVVLGFAMEAGAAEYAIRTGTEQFGIVDIEDPFLPGSGDISTYVCAGPLGSRQVPFTATQGLVGFCVIVVGLVAMVPVATVRWRKRAM